MDTSLDDKVTVVTAIFRQAWLMPTIVIILLGPLVGLAMVVWSFAARKALSIDYFGLSVCGGMLFLYVLMPIGLHLGGENDSLDVMRHGFFGIADLYTWALYCLVLFVIALWSILRIYKIRKCNFGVSLLFYSILNMAALFVGWLVAGRYGGAWTS